jgi:signal peptidase II
LKKYLWNYAMLVGIAGIIIAFDQWTKALVRTNIPIGETWSPWPWLAPIARIVNWNNTGAAFGFFQGYNSVLIILAIVVSIVIIYYFPKVEAGDWVMRVALGLMLGGALGNLVDRLTLGRVTDFISVGSFAVFNVADSSITIGTIILILAVWYKERKEKKGSASSIGSTEHRAINDRKIQGEGDQLE